MTQTKVKAGDRVGAVRDAVKGKVNFFGFGTYEGEEIPGEDVVIMGRRYRDAMGEKAKNPKIKLDDGDIVWGCECWWSSEEAVKKEIGDRTVVNVSIKDYREEGRKVLEKEKRISSILKMVLSYAQSNLDDLNEAFAAVPEDVSDNVTSCVRVDGHLMVNVTPEEIRSLNKNVR